MDYLINKVETFEGINNNPIAPTSEQAGNGSHLISQLNNLIDGVQLESDVTLDKNIITKGLLVVPIIDGVKITSGNYVDNNGIIYSIDEQDVTSGIVADTSRQFVILNYNTGIARIEQDGYNLIANEIKLATISTELTADKILFGNMGNSYSAVPYGSYSNKSFTINFNHPNYILNSINDELIVGETGELNYTEILIYAYDFNTYNSYYKIIPITNTFSFSDFSGWNQSDFYTTYPIKENQFTGGSATRTEGTGTISGTLYIKYYYCLSTPNQQVINITLKNSAQLKDNFGGHQRIKDYSVLIPNKLYFNGNYYPFQNNGTFLTHLDLYFQDSNEWNYQYNDFGLGYFNLYYSDKISNAFSELYIDLTSESPSIYLESSDGTNTQYALDYWGDFVLSGVGYSEKIKLSINNNGEIYINGIKVLETQKSVLGDLAITATTGTLPTPNQTLTIADASVPTVQELLEYCTELQAQIIDLKTQLKSHGLII